MNGKNVGKVSAVVGTYASNGHGGWQRRGEGRARAEWLWAREDDSVRLHLAARRWRRRGVFGFFLVCS